MPTVGENKRQWNDGYHWEDGGAEWSRPWGTVSDQWTTTILRRIFGLLPTLHILEIAPGFGRWVPYLIANSSRYVGIDISPRCVSYCTRTFGQLSSRPRFLLGDGMSLAGVGDASISLAFSFDSLVHVEMDCLTSYAAEIARVLEPGGHAFLHHSNLGEYFVDEKLSVRQVGWRGRTVTAERVRDAFLELGFCSIAHEKIKWVFDDSYCDCFTLVRKPYLREGREPVREGTIFYNDGFADELAAARLISKRYTAALTA